MHIGSSGAIGIAPYNIMAFAETHVVLPGVHRRRVYHEGWQSYWSCAMATGRGNGSSGGTAILVGQSLASFSPAKMRGCEEVDGVQQCDNWALAVVRLRGGVRLVLGVVYLTCTIGPVGSSALKLASLGVVVQRPHAPFLLMGDWNMDPSDLVG